jgi:integrase
VRLAQWKEFDLERMIWNVPPEHLKMGYLSDGVLPRPITKPMLAVLEELQKRCIDHSPEAIVFQTPYHAKGCRTQDPGYIARFLREQIKWETKITAHGFRSTLRDWCRANRFPGEWWDIQVDHSLGDKTSQAYGPDKLLEQRRGMMELWGEYCSHPAPKPKTGSVVDLAEKRRTA